MEEVEHAVELALEAHGGGDDEGSGREDSMGKEVEDHDRALCLIRDRIHLGKDDGIDFQVHSSWRVYWNWDSDWR